MKQDHDDDLVTFTYRCEVQISYKKLLTYLERTGWKQAAQPNARHLIFEREGSIIVLPSSDPHPRDINHYVTSAIETLAAIENVPQPLIVERIQEPVSYFSYLRD